MKVGDLVTYKHTPECSCTGVWYKVMATQGEKVRCQSFYVYPDYWKPGGGIEVQAIAMYRLFDPSEIRLATEKERNELAVVMFK